MRIVLVVVACAMVLGGCIRRERQEREIGEADAKEDAFCLSIGAKKGSSDYTNCRVSMRQELLRKHAAETSRARETTTCTYMSGLRTTVCD